MKLALAPGAVRAMGAALTRASLTPPSSKRLDNTYFDTPAGLLLSRGATLRLRRQGRAWLQTLKGPADSRGGALNRAEWEMPAPGGHLRLDLFTDPAAHALLDGAHPCDLRPLFTSTIRRRVYTLPANPGTTAAPDAPPAPPAIEACLDQGVIEVPGHAPVEVCEVELEALNGAATGAGSSVAALYDWALALNATAPLAVETRTKAERGYAAAGLGGEEASAPLRGDEPAGLAFAALLRRGMAQWARAQAAIAAADGDLPPPEGVHQMRVALRRLRSCIGLFRPCLADPEGAATLARALGDLARALGDARAWDVFATELLAPPAQSMPDHPALAAALAAAQQRRADAYERVRRTLADPATAAVRLRLARWIDTTDWPRAGDAGSGADGQADGQGDGLLALPAATLAARLLHRRWRAVRRRAHHFARQDAPARHELRIALKKLRYATEFFRDLLPARPTRVFLDRVAVVQDQLGHLNDVATLEEMITRMEQAPSPGHKPGHRPDGDWHLGMGMVLGWHAATLHAREGSLRAAVRDLVLAGPPPHPDP